MPRFLRHVVWVCSGTGRLAPVLFVLIEYIREATLHGIFFTPSNCRVTLEQMVGHQNDKSHVKNFTIRIHITI